MFEERVSDGIGANFDHVGCQMNCLTLQEKEAHKQHREKNTQAKRTMAVSKYRAWKDWS